MLNLYSIRTILLFFLAQCCLSSCNLFEKEFILPLPVAVEASEVNAIAFTAHWKKVTGAASYEIDVALDEEFTVFVDNYHDKKVNDLSLTIEGLEADTTYYYRIRANISSQTSKNSNVIKVTTQALDVPVAYPATEVSSTGFRVHWKKMPQVTDYHLDVALDEGFHKFLDGYKALEVEAKDTSLLISNIAVNKQYFYRVRVKQSKSFSEYSNVQSIFTSTLPRPVVLPASNIELTSFIANWQAMPEATTYQIDVAKDPLFQQIMPGYDKHTLNDNNLVVPNLEANTEYFYRVRAVNDEATSNHSEVMTVRTRNLVAPIATSATAVQSGSFQANWNLVPNAASYLLDVALDAGFNQLLPSYNSLPVINNATVVQGLDASTTYFFRVRVKGLGATSDYSNTIQVTTGLLPAPIATAATNQKAFDFMANWQVQPNISLYLLDVATDAGFTNFVPGYQAKEVTGSSHKIEGLDFRTIYYYRLRSKKLSKISDYSNIMQVDPCISAGCKISDLLFFRSGASQSHDQKFTYDAQHRITRIRYTDFADLSYVVTYNADGTIARVNYIFNGATFYDYIYTYNANKLLESVRQNNSSGGFLELWKFTYNAQGQRISWSTYNNLAGTSLTRQFNYTHDSRGNVTEVRNQSNAVVRRYTYDNKLSPYALFNQPDLSFFIGVSRDQWTTTSSTVSFVAEWRGFLPVNNVIKEEISGRSSEVFIFTSNSKDVANAQDAFYSVTFQFTGCTF